MIFVGDDWAEAHHDICIEDDVGNVLVKRRVSEGLVGIAQFHALVADHIDDPSEVVIGIETDRGLFVGALVSAGYQVFAINPFSVSRYRDRHGSSGAKSDPGDAKVLAGLVRTDRHNHRPVAGDSELGESVKVLARAHQNLIWSRQRQVSNLRSTLREFYPGALDAFGDDLDSGDALSVLQRAPTPEAGRSLSRSKIESALRHGGRQRNIEAKAAEIQKHLRAEHLEARPLIAHAFGKTVSANVAVIGELSAQIAGIESELATHFEKHPDAEIIRSLPGLGSVLGARVLAEFGDDPNRYADAKSRKNYAGTSPSPGRRERNGWFLLDTPETEDLPTLATCGPSQPSRSQKERGLSMTLIEPMATAIIKPYVRSATDLSAFSTAALLTAAFTMKPLPGQLLKRRSLDKLWAWDV